MYFWGKKRLLAVMAGLLAAFLLTGCGDSGEKTKEAMAFVQALDYESALSAFDAAEESGENERLIARGRGIAHMGLAEYDEAIACFREALASSSGIVEPMDFDLNYYLAAACVKAGRYAEATEVYSAILGLKPEEKDAYFLRGCARIELGEFENATADFDRVVAMEPTNYERLIQIYEVLAHHGYKEEGRAYLRSALDSGTKQMNAYESGRIYYYLEEYQKAYIALEEAKESGDAESYLYLGRAYEATGDYNYASNVYNSYLTRKGENAEVYNQLGLCEMQKGEYRKALDAFQSGLKLEDSAYQQMLSYNEIVAYEHLGEFRKATVLLQSYLKAYPDDLEAKREMEFLSTR